MIIATGGTAGHVNPGLAVAVALQRAAPQLGVLFVGGSGHAGFESRLIESAGHRLRQLSATPMAREGAAAKGVAAINLLRGIVPARRVLIEERASVVLGLGGYASAAPLLAARTLGIRTAILECNVSPGLANRWFGRIADTAFVAVASTAAHFPRARVAVSGVPLRNEIVALAGLERSPPDRHRPARILVLGGSEGSPFLNGNAPALCAEVVRLGRPIEVRHACGFGDPAAIAELYRDHCVTAEVSPYFDDVAADYRWADFAVACAGAGSIAELAAAGLPALLVPLAAAARDHQAANADLFARAGAGRWVSEHDFDPCREAAGVVEVLSDPLRWQAAVRASRGLHRPGAASAVAEGLLALTR